MKKIPLLTLLLSLSACQSGPVLPLSVAAPPLNRFAAPLSAPISASTAQPGSFQFTAIKDMKIQFTGGQSFMRISVEYQLKRGENAFKRQVQFKYLIASKEVSEIAVLAGDRGSAEELKQECTAIMRLQIKQ
ncbi:MAG: hypothetical protein IV090_10460 [Candidatus Sericytochromatia bacterium]|nr:hypothetical protein [Candidatus Sericytochromatia bacterium]